jgi:hypothetical protein
VGIFNLAVHLFIRLKMNLLCSRFASYKVKQLQAASAVMADADGEKKKAKKGWQPKRADWRAGAAEVTLRVCVFGRVACSWMCCWNVF